MPYTRIPISNELYINNHYFNDSLMPLQGMHIIPNISDRYCDDCCRRKSADQFVFVHSLPPHAPLSSPRKVFFGQMRGLPSRIFLRRIPLWSLCCFDDPDNIASAYKLRINFYNRDELKKSIPIIFDVLFRNNIVNSFKYLIESLAWPSHIHVMFNKLTVYLNPLNGLRTGLPDVADVLTFLFDLDTALHENHIRPGICTDEDFSMNQKFEFMSARYDTDEHGEYVPRRALLPEQKTRNTEICRNFFVEMMRIAG